MFENPQIYPWQTKIAQTFSEHSKQPSSAYIISGNSQLEKQNIIEYWILQLSCQNKNEQNQPCLQCYSCQLICSGNYPNLVALQPEEKKTNISTAQIRKLNHFFSLAPHQNNYRIVLITEGEKLNIGSQNAMLKILEEPPEKTIFIILVAQKSYLLTTIISRCIHIKYPQAQYDSSLEWLKTQTQTQTQTEQTKLVLALLLANNNPLDTLFLLENYANELDLFVQLDLCFEQPSNQLIGLSDKLATMDLLLLVDWLMNWYSNKLKTLKLTSLEDSYYLYFRYLIECKKNIVDGYNYNKKLLVESLLIRLKNLKLN